MGSDGVGNTTAMEGTGGERRVLTVGGKGSTLTYDSVFNFSRNGTFSLRIDPSALSHLSFDGAAAAANKFRLQIPSFLTAEELRASLLVFLNKLIKSSNSSSSPCIASACSQLLDALNRQDDFAIETLDDDESGVVRNCWSDAPVIAICALLDYKSSALSTVADAVASFSCEALKADSSSFALFTDSGDGSSDKDSVSVATDLKIILNDSKLLGNRTSLQLSDIPTIHGCLRSAIRSIHTATRVQLNNSPIPAAAEALGRTLSDLAFSIRNVGKSSLRRLALLADSNHNNNPFVSGLAEVFNSKCPSLTNLDDSYKSFQAADYETDYVKAANLIHSLFDQVRKVVSWEATFSFVSLEMTESRTETPREDSSRGNLKAENKRDKKKKKVMGKGTTVLIQYIKDILQFEKKAADIAEISGLTQQLSSDFLSLLDPKDPDFECLVQKVKEVVDSNESRRRPKIPKGTRDFAKEQMLVREKAFLIIADVFKRHGAMPLDTPVFEMKETLTGKYGEDSKLIYDLADQGGELCSLRYDLTVPFARYVAQNGLTSFRRYHIGKVYRRDNPSKGRYREFYQCDFDIAGDETVGADFEAVKILTELLNELKIGDYEIKLSHRKLLDGMLDICGVPLEKVRTICSSIDKLDKQPWEQIEREMVEEKGLNGEVVKNIGSYVTLRGHPLELLSKLKKDDSKLLKNVASDNALKDLERLFNALEEARCLDKVVLDFSLARGLDYYTGVIYEAVLKGDMQVGSIASGGRYDNLIGMFGTKHVPAIGVSLGIERVFLIMEQLQKDQNQVLRASETQVLVSVLRDDLPLAARLVSQCWDAKLKAEFMVHRRVTKHFDRAKESRIPWMVIVGERELSEGIVMLKDMVANKEEAVQISTFVEELISRLKVGGSS